MTNSDLQTRTSSQRIVIVGISASYRFMVRAYIYLFSMFSSRYNESYSDCITTHAYFIGLWRLPPRAPGSDPLPCGLPGRWGFPGEETFGQGRFSSGWVRSGGSQRKVFGGCEQRQDAGLRYKISWCNVGEWFRMNREIFVNLLSLI